MKNTQRLPIAVAIAALGFAAISSAQGALPWVNAEVRKVDPAASKITLRHEDIPNLDMHGMTMVFQVKEPSLLANIRSGDKVRFTVDKVNGAFVVQSMEPAVK
ncbi:copper-binding protein [Variovorax sp. VNK109]|jgi:Cu(I)/Ag(I) efflux system protein CusF|uniref:copper-binding protein n=1 Tax=Variovorax sp. VNK109 TaxID=3400919 RepID=UPI003C016435